MAEYIKFRLTAAKAAVTMAFMALVGGAVSSAEANQKGPDARAASSSAQFLKLDGITGITRTAFLKLDLALASLEHKLSTEFFSAHKINTTFLKIKSANTDFLKILTANANFLKLSTANANFLKIDDANLNFLKITDANNEFLKLTGTAANSSELGGLTPDAFFQGRGNVVSGAATVSTGGAAQQLLSLPGGIIVVTVSQNSDGIHLTINNGTSSALPAVQTQGGQAPGAVSLAPGTTEIAMTRGTSIAYELTLQILPNASFQSVVTMILTTDPGPSTTEVAAQAFTGGV
jgi:hypothetical protein